VENHIKLAFKNQEKKAFNYLDSVRMVSSNSMHMHLYVGIERHDHRYNDILRSYTSSLILKHEFKSLLGSQWLTWRLL